ncbi:TorF family putative porin [Undibacterium cyanobacteriorum]|uniref:TorF family putative porin n=1 Tax=Undibacterium cyanobacteriorum TaxID=3073561 RepID=A0ABY9RHI0_9BURK|nr:TorF family putative porin [Undibacterium sp. 20NA77.5]WMW80692.1 TorF family putative porin [Undibacterium sp. 20NA77.5]
MKKILLCAAVASTFMGSVAHADDAKPAEAQPEHVVSFNLGAVTDYRYRGISQSGLKPALQGGADYTNNVNGLYAGAWLSTIKWTKDAGGGGSVEVDLYAGKRGEIASGITYDVGVLSYVYPSNDLGKVKGFVDANTTELYGQLSNGPVYIKYSHSFTNTFAFVDSKGSGYLDVGANLEMSDGYTLNLHAGRQTLKNNSAYAYNDWKIGVTKELGGVNFSLSVIGTNADDKLYVTPSAKFTGKTSLQLLAVKTF